MAVSRSNQEILEFAITRELEAYHFYAALADHVSSPKVAKIFQQLAAEELEHKQRLELEVMKTGSVVPPYEKVAPSEHSYVVPDLEAKLELDYKDILLLAMEKEQAAFESYVNLLAVTEDLEARRVLMELAEQEVRHKLRFEAEYEILLKGG